MIKRHLKKFTRDKRGSAIVVVLVAMTFIVVLASILLYLSLVNIQMKNLDRSGKKSFYDAEGVMNEVRAQVQYVVSEAINKAYTDVLDNYYSYEDKNEDESIDDEREAAFKDKFLETLYTQTILKSAEGSDEESGDTYPPLFTDASGRRYSPGTLAEMIGTIEGATVSGSDPAEPTEMVYHATDDKYIKLTNLVVTYKTSKGFYTSVTADIKITIPGFKAISASATQSNLPEFTIIANEKLHLSNVSSGHVTVKGNVYTGSVEVLEDSNSLAIAEAGYFVSKGDIAVTQGALTVDEASSVWANGIVLEKEAEFTLGGDAYIANDLNLHGSEASAVLTGSFVGFGSSTTDSSQSSSIIVNGLDTLLDMSGIDTLILAGHSFVNYGSYNETTGQYAMMGQSVAVKSDQLAYLVPESCLGTISVDGVEHKVTNPFEYGKYEDILGPNPDNDKLEELVLIGENGEEALQVTAGKTLHDYGIKAENLLYMREVVGARDTGTRLVYFVMNFPSVQKANEYFADYFSEHVSDIQKYLNVYCKTGYMLDQSASVGLSGNAYYPNGETLGLIDATGVTSLDEYEKTYTNLCKTLKPEGDKDSGATSPYTYYVTDELSGLGGGTRYYPEGSGSSEAQAIVSGGSVTINSEDAGHVHIVIAAKDVTVNSDFTGLIIAGGNVELNADVKADSGLVTDALEALKNDDDGDGWYVYRYLNPEQIRPVNQTPGSSGENENDNNTGWDMNALVSYENWTKNEA